MDLKKKVTIVIPTYNRYDKLSRLLHYFESSGFPINIIVLDSSIDKKKKPEGLQKLLKQQNIEYVDFPSELFLYKKISNGLQKIATPYVVLCADDDFITPAGIRSSVEFLENNPDYSVAHGQYISFWLDTSSMDKKRTFCWRPGYISDSVMMDEPETRLMYHFGNYVCPTFYGVHRTSQIQGIFYDTTQYTDDLRFGELLPSMITLIKGKMKRLDSLYYGREKAVVKSYVADFATFKQEGTYDAKYNRFKDCISQYLSKETGLSSMDAGGIIDEGMNLYLAMVSKNKKKTLINKLKRFSQSSSLGVRLYELLKELNNKSLFCKKRPSSYFMDWPYSKDSEDYNLIKSLVLATGANNKD